MLKQLVEYTEHQVLPEVESIRFGHADRGRPRAGREAKVCSLDEAQKLIKDGRYKHYANITIRFVNDCHIYHAHVEQVFEKRMLVIEGIGIVTSVSC